MPADTVTIDSDLTPSGSPGSDSVPGEPTDLDVLPSGDVLFVDADDDSVYQLEGPSAVSVVARPSSPVDGGDDHRLSPVAVAGHENQAFIADADGTVFVTERDEELETFIEADAAVDGPLLTLAAGPDGLYVGGVESGQVARVDFDDPEQITEVDEIPTRLSGLDVGSDGTLYRAIGSVVLASHPANDHQEQESVEFDVPDAEGASTTEFDPIDVAAGADDSVHVLTDEGLVSVSADGEDPVLRPAMRGKAVTAGEDGVWVTIPGTLRHLPDAAAREGAAVEDVYPPPVTSSVDLETVLGDGPGRTGDIVALPREEEVGPVRSLTLGGADAALVLGSQNGIFEMSPYGATYQIGDPSNPPLGTSDTPDTYVADDGSVFLLSDGALTRYGSDRDPSTLAVGAASTEVRLTHMAAGGGRVFLTDATRLFVLDGVGVLDGYGALNDVREILALAAGADGDAYVAYESDDGRIVVTRSTTSDDHEVFALDRDLVRDGFRPDGMAVHTDGTVILTESASGHILRRFSDQEPTVIAGDAEEDRDPAEEPFPLEEAPITDPHSPVIDDDGTLFFVNDGVVNAVPHAAEDRALANRLFSPINLAILVSIGAAVGVVLFVRRRTTND